MYYSDIEFDDYYDLPVSLCMNSGQSSSKPGKLFVISGPSGVGKTSLINVVLPELVEKKLLQRVITYTTRKPRRGEVAGRDYHYVSLVEFKQKIIDGFFLEHSKAYTDYYGSSASILEKVEKGMSFLMVIDQIGAQLISQKYPQAVLIWIIPPNINVLEERLRARNTEKEDRLCARIELAKKELAEEQKSKLFGYHIINDCFLSSAESLKEAIMLELSR